MASKSVSILGCGFLGLHLAKTLINESYEVKGSSTSENKIATLQNLGLQAYHIQLPLKKGKFDFFNSDYLVINIPPGTSKNGVDFHRDCIQSIIPDIPEKQKILYVSATSVYPKVDHSIDEEHELDHQSDRAQALIKAEQLLQSNFQDRLTILRLGGLLGYERIPGKYYAGKKLEQYEQKVNYIHRDDAVGIINSIIRYDKWGYTFNGVASNHPSKKDVFQKNAEDYDFEPPVFENSPQKLTNRIIKSSKIESILDYSFLYPDPMHFFYIK